ncbi:MULTISPECIES: hypothetical protein [unclassified Bradyrhizobium]|uniref:hypothetical protein n=1 Tax=unclassified Bradyrhizobium TaxID=2631580 RepID=UPI0028F16EC5|nr:MULTISPECIES: hypothetical protein [unclassified Bradyrhizobium]
MADFLKFATEWPIVKAAPWSFAGALIAATLLLAPIIWLVVSLLKNEQLAGKETQIATKNAEIDFLQRQLTEYQNKLKVGSPDEAMQKLAELEQYSPRRLRQDQKDAIERTFRPKYEYRWLIQIYHYRECYDCADYGRQIRNVLQKDTSGSVGLADFSGGDFDDKEGLYLAVANPNEPPPIALLLAKTLSAANLNYTFTKSPFLTSDGDKTVNLLILPSHRV